MRQGVRVKATKKNNSDE